MAGLSDEDREALVFALLCDEEQMTTDAQAGAVLAWAEEIVRRAREAAWSEGWQSGMNDASNGTEADWDATPNPYCAADDAHGASQGPGGAEVDRG